MIAQPGSPLRRRAPLRAALLLTVPVTLLGLSATAASADTPTRWESTPAVSPLAFLAVVLLIPIALILVISGLVWVGTMRSVRRHAEHDGWQGSTWFGAPTRGTSAVDTVDDEAVAAQSQKGGGASARW